MCKCAYFFILSIRATLAQGGVLTWNVAGMQAAGPTCQSHPLLSVCYSLFLSLSLIHQVSLVNPDLLQVVHNDSSRHICS